MRRTLEQLADRMIAAEEPGITPRDLNIAASIEAYLFSCRPTVFEKPSSTRNAFRIPSACHHFQALHLHTADTIGPEPVHRSLGNQPFGNSAHRLSGSEESLRQRVLSESGILEIDRIRRVISTLPVRTEEKSQVCIIGSGAAGAVLAMSSPAAALT